MKILSVFGTRPEAIKMAPLLRALAVTPGVESRLAVTAQHREMLDQVLRLFSIQPDYDLDLMRAGQTLPQITEGVLHHLTPILLQEQPDLLLVHGDTSTTFSAALAAFYQQIPVGHIEAGLRTADKYAPFPEEINRRLVAQLADWHFAPTPLAKRNLLAEGIAETRIFVTGNTVIDALLATVRQPCDLTGIGLDQVDWQKRVLLVTCHRRENWGRPMEEIFAALAAILEKFADVEVVFPLHKNPRVRQTAYAAFAASERIHFCEPLDYLPFCHLIQRAHLVVSDSGGLQEEAPALGKPVLVLRATTERPEAIEAGTALLVGVEYATVYRQIARLLTDAQLYEKMATAVNPYGDGHSAGRISQIIVNKFLKYAGAELDCLL